MIEKYLTNKCILIVDDEQEILLILENFYDIKS